MRLSGTPIYTFLLICLLSVHTDLQPASPHFRFDATCKKAYKEILALRLESGMEILNEARLQDPSNLMPVFIENYIDFLRIYISEENSTYYTLELNKAKRIKELERGPKDSPFYLYVQAEVNLQWAIARLKFGEYFQAFREIKRAYTLLETNKRNFPEFLPNLKSLGILHAAIGAIPDQYKWGVNLLGMDGSIDEGMQELRTLIAHPDDFEFRDETMILYTFLLLHLQKDEKEAWKSANSEDLSLKDNLLNHFVRASVAMHTGHNKVAREILISRPRGTEYQPFHFLDYMEGLVKIRMLDPEADKPLLRFVKNFKGNNYIKEAYQKLAWHALIHGNTSLYEEFMRKCIDHGNALIDADKAAHKEAESGKKPNILLLKTRLLFDGGYYKEALILLDGYSVDDFGETQDKVEFTYRAGRIYDEWGQDDKAIGYYYATIKNGKDTNLYYPPNAALKLGLIYERKGDKDKSAYFYKKALSYKGHDYKAGIDSQAKAGLNRIR